MKVMPALSNAARMAATDSFRVFSPLSKAATVRLASFALWASFSWFQPNKLRAVLDWLGVITVDSPLDSH